MGGDQMFLPLGPLTCVYCGVIHHVTKAERHYCCSGPQLIPVDIWMICPNDEQLISEIADIYSLEFPEDAQLVTVCLHIDGLETIETIVDPANRPHTRDLPIDLLTELRRLPYQIARLIARDWQFYHQKNPKISHANPYQQLRIA